MTIKKITETVSEFGGEAKDQMEKLGRSAAWTMDEAREQTGEALHEAASSVRSTGVQGSEAIGCLAGGTADRLDATAAFIEEHDLQGAITGLRRFGKRHMTSSLVAAAAIGFLAGSALTRATHSFGKRN